jgi:hypothetical protein
MTHSDTANHTPGWQRRAILFIPSITDRAFAQHHPALLRAVRTRDKTRTPTDRDIAQADVLRLQKLTYEPDGAHWCDVAWNDGRTLFAALDLRWDEFELSWPRERSFGLLNTQGVRDLIGRLRERDIPPQATDNAGRLLNNKRDALVTMLQHALALGESVGVLQ